MTVGSRFSCARPILRVPKRVLDRRGAGTWLGFSWGRLPVQPSVQTSALNRNGSELYIIFVIHGLSGIFAGSFWRYRDRGVAYISSVFELLCTRVAPPDCQLRLVLSSIIQVRTSVP